MVLATHPDNIKEKAGVAAQGRSGAATRVKISRAIRSAPQGAHGH